MASSTDVLAEPPAGRSDAGPVGGSLTELAALEAARDEKRQLLDSAAKAAAVELGPRPRLPDGCSPGDLPMLLRRYYWSEPAAEVLGHDPAELAGLAIGHLRLAAVRPPGSATVDVHRLAGGRGGGRGRWGGWRRGWRQSRHPAGHRRHAVPRRLRHRGGRPAGCRARAHRP